MLKRFITPSFAFVAFTGASIIAVACSSEPTSTFTPDTDAGANDGSPILVPEGGFEGGLDASASCEVKIASDYKAPAFVAATADDTACSAKDIDDYFDACLKEPLKTEKDGTCANWKTAHKKCGDCAEPTNNSGPIQWHSNRNVITENLGGCIALTQGKPNPGDCGESVHNVLSCERDACLYCLSNPPSQAQFDAYSRCTGLAAKAGVCASYVGVQNTACKGVNDPDGGSLPCLKVSTEGFDVYDKRLVKIFCSK